MICLLSYYQSPAQDYRYQMDNIEKVYIVANTSIILKAHSDPQLVIPSPENKRVQRKDTAKGATSGQDNTGFNVFVEKVRRTLNIESLQPRFADPLIIYLPETIKVSVENRFHTDIRISGLSSEIEVKADHGDVILENVTGPLIVDCGHGKTSVNFSEVNQQSPMSIVNSHGVIDVTIPAETNADIELSVPRGELNSEFELEGVGIDQQGFKTGRTSANLTSKLNGGGVSIMIFSSWGDVFIRKK
ncbi:MAG: hypothetical protein AAFO69_11865 [Bacteroidota bacterium]